MVGGLLLLASVGGVLAFAYWPTGQPTGHPESRFHWHVKLEVFDVLANTSITIPADIGVASDLWKDHRLDSYGVGVMAPLHTHDETGLIHVEFNAFPPERQTFFIQTGTPFTLGDFFRIWGRPLSRTCILDYCANAEQGRPPPAMSVGGPVSGKTEDCVNPNWPLRNTEQSEGGPYEITIIFGAAPPQAIGCF